MKQQEHSTEYDLTVRRRGSRGPLIVFLHGEDGTARSGPFLEALGEHARVIEVVLPGYDGTPIPAWLDDMQDLAFFLTEWMKREAASNIHLVGHSLGGWLAAEMAMLNSTRLASLTLIAPGGLRQEGTKLFDVFLAASTEVARASVRDADLAAQLVLDASAEDRADLLLQNRFMTARLAWQPRFYSPRLAKWLHLVALPTQIIWGAEDRIFPVGLMAAFESRLTHSTTHVLTSCGHLPHTERTQDVAELVRLFTRGFPS
ncbi:MAG: alpha/beta hydrolase [Hyphomicrobiales bacterium]|nr:alpha/beta hydrolase [Hyphomicrobiales bacterium]